MLNEAPKKQKKQIDYSHPTGWQLFWRTQGECWRRMVTPYLMYLFMSLIMLAFQALGDDLWWLRILIGVVCIGGGAFYNGHLCYHYGKLHYGAYVAGCLHRQNEALGIKSGGDHRPEREYSPWKGFYIGFLVGVPVILLGILAGAFLGTSIGGNFAGAALVMFAGWAILPVSWLNLYAGTQLSFYWSIVMIVLPITVSGIFYIVGALREKREREEETARTQRIEAAGAAAKKEMHEQTEEQRRKTLQSKKKK